MRFTLFASVLLAPALGKTLFRCLIKGEYSLEFTNSFCAFAPGIMNESGCLAFFEQGCKDAGDYCKRIDDSSFTCEEYKPKTDN